MSFRIAPKGERIHEISENYASFSNYINYYLLIEIERCNYYYSNTLSATISELKP